MFTKDSKRFDAAVCALVLASLMGCGGHHEGGGAGGAAGTDAGSAGAGGSAAGAGGAAGSAGAGAIGGATGSSGGGPLPGYDRVVGCAGVAWPEVATFTFMGNGLEQRFYPDRLSGDGRVAAGRLQSASFAITPVRWRAGIGFIPIEGIAATVEQLSCTGDIAIMRSNIGIGIFREAEGSGAEYLFGNEEEGAASVGLSPDASVVIANLDSIADPGPYPVRWTRATGVQRLDELRNSVIYHTSGDGRTLLGSDSLHVYRWHEGAGKTLLLVQVPLGFGFVPNMPVSADGGTVVFSSLSRDSVIDSITVAQPPAYNGYRCPSVPCHPQDISGTGAAVLVSAASESGGTLVWTAKHGFRSITALVQQYGGDTQGRVLQAHNMSDDGQVFTGYAVNVSAAFNDSIAFYATLPLAAYD
ncbi:MAG: hypothetical protein K0R38_4621 [Polyangiaceae bacterium]|jgi:hypothetical protein|nr:hypothetical protein [Polyangiaceae bacterium]